MAFSSNKGQGVGLPMEKIHPRQGKPKAGVHTAAYARPCYIAYALLYRGQQAIGMK